MAIKLYSPLRLETLKKERSYEEGLTLVRTRILHSKSHSSDNVRTGAHLLQYKNNRIVDADAPRHASSSDAQVARSKGNDVAIRTRSRSNDIIENGMRYIIFFLHLLLSSIFGTNLISANIDKTVINVKETDDFEKKVSDETIINRHHSLDTLEVKKMEKGWNSWIYNGNTSSSNKNCNDMITNDNAKININDTITITEGTSRDRWCNVNNSMNVNILFDYNEKWISNIILKPRCDFQTSTFRRINSSTPSNSWTRETKGSTLSLLHAEKVARILHKPCASADDELSSSSSNFSSYYASHKQNSSRTHEKKQYIYDSFAIQKIYYNENEQSSYKNRDKNRDSRPNSPNKCTLRLKKMLVKDKKIVPTDNNFYDERIKTIPVDMRFQNKHLQRSFSRKMQTNLYQMQQIDCNANYVVNDENSNDCATKFVRNQNLYKSTSSTNLILDDYKAVRNTDTRNIWLKNPPNSNNIRLNVTRAPPGFPEFPQNPPLTLIISENNQQSSTVKNVYAMFMPPAPAPLRHLYYDYPEFMVFP